jgi:hypothetical protein
LNTTGGNYFQVSNTIIYANLDLGDLHEMVSALNNVPPFEKPTIWNKNPLSPEDSKFVKAQFESKLNKLNNKDDFKLEELDDKNDILKKVR